MASLYKIRRKADGLFLSSLHARRKKGQLEDAIVWGPNGRTWSNLKALERTCRRCLQATSDDIEIIEFSLEEKQTIGTLLLDNRAVFLYSSQRL